jgi:hypothetical protein
VSEAAFGAGLFTFLVINSGLLTHRLWRLIRERDKPVTTPKWELHLDLLCDALAVIFGIYLIGAIIVATTSGLISHWEFLDYMLMALIATNIALPIVCAVFINRVIDRQGQ